MDSIKQSLEKKSTRDTLYIAGFMALMIMCLLHVNVGVELSDTGYSLANFVKFFSDSGTWVLATFLANFTGAVITRLPLGGSMLGMQIYSHFMLAAFVAFLYFYLPKYLSRLATFLGLLMAVSLAWCPKVILYNYLTYYLFTIAAILIWEAGYTYKKKDCLLFIAGIVLSLSLFVRFPNLCECLLIVPVIYNSVLRKETKKMMLRKVELCIAGFLTGAVIISLIIMIFYGASAYFDMIVSLFSMHNTDSSYSMRGMIESIIRFYVECILEMGALLVATVVATVVFNFVKNKYLKYICAAAWVCVICGYLLYAYKAGFFWRNYNDLTAVRMLATYVVICSIIGYIIIFFKKNMSYKFKSLAMIMLTIIIVTPLGSNNALYPVYNNLFLVAPFDFYLLIYMINKKPSKIFAANVMCIIVMTVTMLQSVMFGLTFTFKCEPFAKELEDNFDEGVLTGMCTNSENKAALSGIINFVDGGDYTDREAICYGNIPALNYYIEVPSPLSSSWPDLNTVLSYDLMKEEIEALEEKPLLIYTVSEDELIKTGEELTDKETYLKDYMKDNGYVKVYDNEEYVIYDIIHK